MALRIRWIDSYKWLEQCLANSEWWALAALLLLALHWTGGKQWPLLLRREYAMALLVGTGNFIYLF